MGPEEKPVSRTEYKKREDEGVPSKERIITEEDCIEAYYDPISGDHKHEKKTKKTEREEGSIRKLYEPL